MDCLPSIKKKINEGLALSPFDLDLLAGNASGTHIDKGSY